MKHVNITKDFYWVGSLDPDLRIFDIIMETEFGTTYNSYVLKGSEKTALFETSKVKCFDSYLAGLEEVVKLRDIDYLVVNHTEPDHTGAIERLLDLNPNLKLVGSAAAVNFMKEISNKDFNATIVKNGDELSLGDKTLRFISVPNLHWPDSMFTYIPEIETLVSCDMFGAHYSDEGVTDDKIRSRADYEKALRYYYDMIMGPFKKEVIFAVDAIAALSVKVIAVGHGPVLVKNPREITETYRKWSETANPNAKKTVVIPYVSAYGFTEIAARRIADGVRDAGDIDVRLHDLVSADTAALSSDLLWADGILLGTPTIVGEALKPIWDLTTGMFAKTHGGKLASAFGSFGWSGEGVPHILERLAQLKMKVYGEGFKFRFKPGEADLQAAYEFGYGFGVSVVSGKIVAPVKGRASKRVWKCVICGELVSGDEAPAACPVCGVGPQQFIEVEVSDTEFVSEKRENFVIIGNGAAGTAACEEIRRRNKVCSVEMISRESVPGYNRPMLTKGILSDIDGINLFLKPADWYDENDIKLTLNANVVAIETAEKRIRLENGESRSYDKLILATGAESFRPPFAGADAENVFAIRTVEDAKKLRGRMKEIESVVVIGGGVLGLEAAWEIVRAGKRVSIVEAGPRLMGRQIDERAGKILKEAVEKSGVTVYALVGVEAITVKDGNATGVMLKDGRTIQADAVLISAGIRQNTELAKAAGIDADKSINVNAKAETSVPDIYACGDCAAFEGLNFAIWSQAIEMGKVAGANAVGDEAEYARTAPANAFSGFGVSLFAIGDNGADSDKKYKTYEIYDSAKHTYEKMYFVNNRFKGGILMGDTAASAKFIEAYENGLPLEKVRG